MKNKSKNTEIAKIILYELVFNKALPDETKIKVARKTAMNITHNISKLINI